MNTVYGLFALCALVARCAAAPNCDGSAVLPCLYPTIAYAISPEGQQLTQVKDSSMITEPQLKGVCSLGKSTITCLKDYVDRCVDKTVPDIHEFIRGTDGLMSVCDKPNLYTDAKVLMACNKKLNTTSTVFQTCHTNLRNSAKDITGAVADPQAALNLWKKGTMLRDICCAIQKLRACLGSEVNDKCGADGMRLDTAVYNALNEAYSCQGRLSSCPA